MYVFTRKWAGAADFRDGEHRVKIPVKPDGKTEGMFVYPAKNE